MGGELTLKNPRQEVWFLDGRVRVDQPAKGYRAGTDAILLAMSVRAKRGVKILDIGTGSGVLPCLINHRYADCAITGIDNQEDMLGLARENTKDRESITISKQDVCALPKSWNQSFDMVVSNPPFFDDINAVRMSGAKRSSFVSRNISLKAWVETMVLMVKQRGVGALICRADRIEPVFAGLYQKAGRIRILPVQSYADTPANRVIIQFRKGVKSESLILPALIMHDENPHLRYTERATAILNGHMPLNMA